ncbi:hypothetical protein [Staphylococcus aureus]|uniref:hypothetical protein n=1 Tax=Staphylococcus aureus TaxID=1280 RepID=UPI00158297D4|nr:hypothetical protein [Staphylococcus aureus]
MNQITVVVEGRRHEFSDWPTAMDTVKVGYQRNLCMRILAVYDIALDEVAGDIVDFVRRLQKVDY